MRGKRRPKLCIGTDAHNVDLKKDLAADLEEARARTRFLLQTISEEDLMMQQDPIMSPLIWDYGHIGNYEELWLLQKAHDKVLSKRELYDVYDASLHPREELPSLNLLNRSDADMYLDAVRQAVLETLLETGFDGDKPLLRDGFVYNIIIQHEARHNETMLQTLQLKKGEGYRPEPRVELPRGKEPEREVIPVPGGEFVMGTDDHARALDNERNAHVVDLPGFRIDATPVTNGAFVEFVEDGGYEGLELWDEKGWDYVKEERIVAPKHWYQPEPHSWWTERFGFDEPLNPAAPEKANLDQLAFSSSEVGAYPAGASAYGVLSMLGDVWEWTASDLYAYPGFEAFPYREYSEIFFGPGYKVLRGGSWATRPSAIRNTFRNWDFPKRRQLFCGFRCAKDG